jgi:HNH endonuclease
MYTLTQKLPPEQAIERQRQIALAVSAGGREKKEIAAHFGVSLALVYKCMERFKFPEPPDSPRNLRKRAAKLVASGANVHDAANALQITYDAARRGCKEHGVSVRLYERGTQPTRGELEQIVRKTPLGCWEWPGKLTVGYGLIANQYGHRYAFELFKGEIPDRKFVLHHCDNRPCVNPAHLYAGTDSDNQRDRQLHDRLAKHLNELQVREARILHAVHGWEPSDIIRRFGIDADLVASIFSIKNRTVEAVA